MFMKLNLTINYVQILNSNIQLSALFTSSFLESWKQTWIPNSLHELESKIFYWEDKLNKYNTRRYYLPSYKFKVVFEVCCALSVSAQSPLVTICNCYAVIILNRTQGVKTERSLFKFQKSKILRALNILKSKHLNLNLILFQLSFLQLVTLLNASIFLL